MAANIFTKKGKFLAIAAVLVAGSAWLALRPAQPASTADNAEAVKAALSVEITQPQAVQWPMTLTLNGGIYPWQEALVSAEIGGLRIRQVLAEVGERVKQGQTLVLLADETVQAELQKQLATVEKDKAALAEAKSNADRAREIKDSGALSAQKINEYVIAEQTARANLALSQAELENQKIRVRQTRVVAPDDGVIASRSANLGNVVASGAELFRLVRQARIEWRGEVNAEQQAQIHAGQAVQLTLAGKQQVSGRVRLLSPTVDDNTRNALVYVDIPKGSAKPGMYVQGQVDVGQQSGMAVPLSAVVYRDGHAYVFALGQVDTQGVATVTQRKVHTGRTRGEQIEVLDGVDAQVQLVLSGGAFLNDGDRVKTITARQPGV